jgi:hypothetical protein
MKDPFEYQPPTPETQPRYEVIRAAESRCRQCIADALDATSGVTNPVRYGLINAACRDFHAVILEQAPAGGDRDAACRAVRLSRMQANEMVANGVLLAKPPEALVDARMWACAAVALGSDLS